MKELNLSEDGTFTYANKYITSYRTKRKNERTKNAVGGRGCKRIEHQSCI